MARNRITGRETQKMQEYTQEQISQAERRGIEFPTDVKEQLFEYANLIGEEEKVRTLVRNLADALSQADEEGVEDLLDDARMDIQELPDPTIGKLELRDYGYTAEDMVPLRKEAALDYHRMGSKIYCLGSDGGKGEYASKEMIQAHEGLFGMESKMWERIEENDLDYADENFGAFQEPMSVINQEEALKLYDAGADIYLITNFSSPIYVTERMEIERGPEHYQMSMAELERFRNLEWEMQKYPQIQSLKEANLLLGTRRTFGIYQIKDDSPGENYAFMNMRFIESHGMQIKKEDYKMVYADRLWQGDTLDSLYEKFNIAHPEDYTGHSLSVSDIVVLNENGTVKAYFVDSISFRELPDFLHLEPELGMDEIAYQIGNQYLAIQVAAEGYDYSFYDKEMKLMDGGVYENPDISIREAIDILLKEEGLDGVERLPVDYEELREKAEQVEQEILHVARERMKVSGEYKPLAKVEELEEANYNMIDNVINNTPPKKGPYLEYYAAECDEFRNVAKYYKSTDLNEIIEQYQKIIDDPSLTYFGNGMGFVYRDPDDSYYDEAEVTIVSGKSIRGDNLDNVAFMVALPVVREALETVRDAFPDFRYYPPKDIREQLFPENMNADELAAALNTLAGDFDFYDYHDYQDRFNPEENLEIIAAEIRCGNAHQYFSYLKDIVDAECKESPRAEVLLEKLKSYQPEVPERMEPIVMVNYCEDGELSDRKFQDFGELDKIVSDMDTELFTKVDEKTGLPEKTVQMYFTIYYPDREQMQKMQGKINIGEGNGGIISQLKLQNEMKLTDESWLNYQKAKGEDSFKAYMADLTDMQEHVLPYLQSFCSLEEKTPEKTEGAIVSDGTAEKYIQGKRASDRSNLRQDNFRKPKKDVEKKSIHERLQINKEIIAKRQGKDCKEKGVELA